MIKNSRLPDVNNWNAQAGKIESQLIFTDRLPKVEIPRKAPQGAQLIGSVKKPTVQLHFTRFLRLNRIKYQTFYRNVSPKSPFKCCSLRFTHDGYVEVSLYISKMGSATEIIYMNLFSPTIYTLLKKLVQFHIVSEKDFQKVILPKFKYINDEE